MLAICKTYCDLAQAPVTPLPTRQRNLTRYFLLGVIVVAWSQQRSKDHRWNIHLLFLMKHHRNSFSVVPNLDSVVFTAQKSETKTFAENKALKEFSLRWETPHLHFDCEFWWKDVSWRFPDTKEIAKQKLPILPVNVHLDAIHLWWTSFLVVSSIHWNENRVTIAKSEAFFFRIIGEKHRNHATDKTKISRLLTEDLVKDFVEPRHILHLIPNHFPLFFVEYPHLLQTNKHSSFLTKDASCDSPKRLSFLRYVNITCR